MQILETGNIAPDYSIPLLQERPPVKARYSVLKRIPIAGSIIARWEKYLVAKKEQELEVLMNKVNCARSRSELETVLGKPKYALPGCPENTITIENKTYNEDRVEAYGKYPMMIDLNFSNDRLIGITGGVSPTLGKMVQF